MLIIFKNNFPEDCFGDMEEPLYGFIMEVTVSKNQTCLISAALANSGVSLCELFGETILNKVEPTTV